MNLVFCPHCGKQHPNQSAFCPETGQPIQQMPAAAVAAAHAPSAPQGYAQQAYAPHAQQAYAPPGQPYASAGPRAAGVRHSYPLAVREAGFATAVGLMMRTMPYALVRFGVLLCISIVTLVWGILAFGGWGLLAAKVHPGVGFGWFFFLCMIYGYVWTIVVRYFLYLLKCGHIAVLTELITSGQIGNGNEGMFAYGKRIVKSRFGEASVLFVVDRLVSGVVRAFNRTLDFVASLLPIPGLSSVVSFANSVIYAATTYIDETIFSYGLARQETNPWASAKDGLIYYAQNSKEILKTGVYAVILDKVLTFFVWVVMLAPAFVISWFMPRAMVGVGFWFVVVFAALLASNVRAAFIKPIFLIMTMTKFHLQVQNQPINQEWDERLGRVSGKFRELDEKMRSYRRDPIPVPAAV